MAVRGAFLNLSSAKIQHWSFFNFLKWLLFTFSSRTGSDFLLLLIFHSNLHTSLEPCLVFFLSTKLASRFFNCPKINYTRTPVSGVWNIEWDTWVNKQIMQRPLAFLIIADNLDCLHMCTECCLCPPKRVDRAFRLILNGLLLHTHSSDSPDCYGSIDSRRDFVAKGQFNLSF